MFCQSLSSPAFLPIEKLHASSGSHFIPPLNGSVLLHHELTLGRIISATAFFVMPLKIVRISGLTKKTRPPHRVGFRDKRSCAIKCRPRLGVPPLECEHIAKSLVESRRRTSQRDIFAGRIDAFNLCMADGRMPLRRWQMCLGARGATPRCVPPVRDSGTSK